MGADRSNGELHSGASAAEETILLLRRIDERLSEKRERTRHEDDHLRILQAIYGILLGFGLRELVEAMLPWTYLPINTLSGVIILASVNVLGLGVRFFFIIEEISNYLIFCWKWNVNFSKRMITLFHYPIVIAQACLFYAVCAKLKHFVLDRNGLPVNSPLEQLKVVVLLQVVLLLTNTVWLLRIFAIRKIAIQNLQEKLKQDDSKEDEVRTLQKVEHPEIVWIISNTAFAVMVGIISFYPSYSAPYSVATAFVVFGLLFFNSILDLALTAKFYVPNQ